MNKLKALGKRVFIVPLVNLLITLNIPPNLITILSLFIAIFAFFAYKNGKFWLGGIILFFSSILDTFDGEIARKTNKVTKFGGFLDSTIDRVNEFLVFLGLFAYYYHRFDYALYWVVFALFGSLMVSYTRARGEGLGISPQVGVFERFVRVLFLIIGSLSGPKFMIYVLMIITIGTFITSIQRIFYLFKNSKSVN
jgi:CDP-diacylglycerol--glycerol-3-phosphate 3-phosphatidyltransferase|uniref:CDP-alcohol phosphatidyltransferase family protein n=1 Tax=candidate division WOR-3 bacterium TaxID=2052148 RepID=A0A7V3VTX1_UNCW3